MSHWCCQMLPVLASRTIQDYDNTVTGAARSPQPPKSPSRDRCWPRSTYACVCQRQNALPLPLCAKQHALILTMVPMVPMIMSHWFDLVCLHGGSTFTKQATLFGRPTCDQQNNEAKTDFVWKLCTKSWQYVPQRMSSTRLGYPWVLAINCQDRSNSENTDMLWYVPWIWRVNKKPMQSAIIYVYHIYTFRLYDVICIIAYILHIHWVLDLIPHAAPTARIRSPTCSAMDL